jgi:hypothetical protein
MRTHLQLTTPAETRRLELARACTVRFSRAHRGVCNRVCVCTVHGGVHHPVVVCVHVHRPANQLCKTRCNRALSRLRQPPELSRHDPDSSTQRAHSCSWPLRLKLYGSNWDTRARCGFHVRAGCVSPGVCTTVVWCSVCARARCTNRVCTDRPTVCAQNTVQPGVVAAPVTSRAVQTRSG